VTFLPILERELRVAGRKPGTIWFRFSAALLGIAIWITLLLSSQRGGPADLSRALFMAISIPGLAISLLAGCFLTADCLSGEKREGTLGLLFLTDLKGYDVVLGKLGATSIHSSYALLSILPLLGLPLLMGGVTVGQFWRVSLTLLATLLFSLGVGMINSALSNQSRQAMASTLLCLLSLSGILPSLWWLQKFLFSSAGFGPLLWLSPVQVFIRALDPYYQTKFGPSDFWVPLTVIFLVGLGCLAVSALLLPRTWQESAEKSPRRKERSSTSDKDRNLERDAVSATVPLGNRTRNDRDLLAVNPYQWLAARDNSSRKFGWKIAGLLWTVFALATMTSIFSHEHIKPFIVCMFAGYALHQVVKWEGALEATRQIQTDRQSGAWELLLVTPLVEELILQGQRRAFRGKFLGLVSVASLVNISLAVMVLGFPKELQIHGKDRFIFLELFIGGLLALWLDFWTIEQLGVWVALRSKKHHRAGLATSGLVMIGPWAGLLLLIFIMNGRSVSQASVPFLFGSWFLLGFGCDAVLLKLARRNLCLRESMTPQPSLGVISALTSHYNAVE
jgi:ABC-type transport system involved in multi-copper enzyme maturation permease subunit